MAKKRRKLRVKRVRSFLFSLALCLISVGLIYALINTGLRVWNTKQELAQLEATRDALLEEKEELEEEVELLSDDDYIIRYARENYIFSKDGEEIAILPDSEE